MTTALIIVDVQHDFLPDGALGVAGGNQIIDPIAALVSAGRVSKSTTGYNYDHVFASRDWHPTNHMSFIENGGIWPAHCVANTRGAEIHEQIQSLNPRIITKGFNPEKEAYSAFDGFVEDKDSPLLHEHLLDNFVTTVDICGLALDYCVRATAMDAVKCGFNPTLFLDLTRPVEYLSGARAIETLVAHGVNIDTTTYS